MAEKPSSSSLVTLLQVLTILVVFVVGVVIGFAATPNINQYLGSKRELIFLTNRGSVTPTALVPEKNHSSIVFVPTPRECQDCSIMDAFLHPRNVTHGMYDAELFWRAALVSRESNYPFARIPKVAFMFLTRGPLPMLPLWEKFFQGQNPNMFSVYVHALPGYELKVSDSSPFHGRQIPSQIVQWGTVELFDAERRLLGNALLDFSNERFILLSESCIPIQNFQTVYKYLTGSKDSFVDSYDEPTRYGRGRYSRNMLPHIHLRHWRKGSQWFELNRDLATYIVSDRKYYSLFKEFCKPACYPDEHYIPTILNMFHGSKNSNRSVTWVDWSFRAPHPASFEEANITADFMRSIRYSETGCLYNDQETHTCYLFARKFAPSALKPLLELSSTVMEI